MNYSHPTEEDAFRGLADGLPLIVSLASPSGELEYVNAHWTAFSGQSADDFLNGD